MKVTKINQAGLNLIKEKEGLYLKAYLCPAKVPTIGYGTIRYPDGTKVKIGDVCTEADAEMYLRHDLAEFEKSVDALCRDDINENQFSALVSFCYNLGAGNLKASTLLKRVNANPNDISIKLEFEKWNKADGKPLRGLTLRRQDEAELYFKPC